MKARINRFLDDHEDQIRTAKIVVVTVGVTVLAIRLKHDRQFDHMMDRVVFTLIQMDPEKFDEKFLELAKTNGWK
jgi:hypothetical protein